MGAHDKAVAATTSGRLKREDCRRTKHDSAFSRWKILIGPSDWEDHSQGKEGAEKYRIQNLPNCTSCAGVYEFGIAISRSRSGREAGKFDLIIPVYLGKADNVRNRLQQYGREGSHLENGSSNCKLGDSDNILAQKDPGLFSEIFSKGYSIVYRWAPMNNSRDAQKTEADLLDTFDYAWNKGSNGPRRPNDILKKLDRSSKTSQNLLKFQLFPQKRKGIKIIACEPPFMENGYDFLQPNNLLYRILKFGRSQPRLVQWRSDNKNFPGFCGVALGHGVVCRRPPAEGRKRCLEHKGMKVNGFTSKLLTEGNFTSAEDRYSAEKEITLVCGVTLDDGSSCAMEPVQGNKRCLEHKGRKIRDFGHQTEKDEKDHYVHGPTLDYSDDQIIPLTEAGRIKAFSGKQHVVNRDCNTICGVDLEDGSFCTMQPLVGRKRCEEHKGMRIREANSRSFTEEVPSLFHRSGAKSCQEERKNKTYLPSLFSNEFSSTCGVVLHDGSFCRRKPAEGNKRCWHHKGMRVEQNHTIIPSIMYEQFSPTCGAALHDGSFCGRKPTEGNKRCWQHKGLRVEQNHTFIPSITYEQFSPTCGAALHDGSFCRRKPTEGNKRCWQHKGMRVDTNSRTSTYSNSNYHVTSSRYASYSSVYEDFSRTCGAPLRNGSYCRRRSAKGRCWQHKG